jgi:ABC-type sugar transport system permease subunit
MTTPALGIMGIFVLLPAASLLVLSFTSWNGLTRDAAWVGWRNYGIIAGDAAFVRALANTGVYVGVTLPLVLVGGLSAALLVERAGKLSSGLRLVFTVPFVVSIAVVAVVWTWILDPNFGILNLGLERVGLGRQRWLQQPDRAMLAIVLPSVWRQFGYYMLILLAGLKSIDPTYHEAAKIDGAGYWARLRLVTLPLLTPQLFFALVICAIDSFQVFAQVDLMTRGGPVNSTSVATYYMYQQGFQFFQMGIASAVAVVLTLMLGALTYAQLRWIGRRVFYQ